ncbi:FMN-linked oxidoreductase [Macrolepiota fuliginosa MF-IS2]|uniref:Dihydroorotate oxidase n=1 Tax=Macrolepiota fuliginosa MF-IS2 TaxID=1400762 RepID=A0A9P5XSG2_9AGAR|nr:FMN-linked oxidoreductase [Macrolepiota fuliginosa MF-IS2]
MVHVNSIDITPPLLNSSCAWSSDLAQLKGLYDSPHTGAITTRTATLNGYRENDSHTFAFAKATTSSINSYGYSPFPFTQYLTWIEELLTTATHYKPIIVSVTSDADDPTSLALMVAQLQALRKRLGDQKHDDLARIAIELNTSCPNIKNSPPPGYDFESLSPLLEVLSEAYAQDSTLTIGLKLPPFVHEQQFHSVLNRITSLNADSPHHGVTATAAAKYAIPTRATNTVISFLTCTNTLGNSLLFADQSISITPSPPPNKDSSSLATFALPTALGGLAGDALHPLALGNVYRFSHMLKGLEKEWPPASRIKIIGVGGVTSREARERMTKAGADAVACATLFGKEGVKAFEILS